MAQTVLDEKEFIIQIGGVRLVTESGTELYRLPTTVPAQGEVLKFNGSDENGVPALQFGAGTGEVTNAQFQAFISNTNQAIAKRIEVANVSSAVSGVSNADFQAFVSNTNQAISRRIEVANTDTNFLRLTGGDISGNVNFGTGDFVNFGPNKQLHVGFSGAINLLRSASDTTFRIASEDLQITNFGGGERLIDHDGSAVNLRHSGSTKLSTTNEGVTITNLVLNTVLGTQYGGTGLSSITDNGVLVGTSGSTLGFVTGTVGKLLQVDDDGSPVFDDLDGGNY